MSCTVDFGIGIVLGLRTVSTAELVSETVAERDAAVGLGTGRNTEGTVDPGTVSEGFVEHELENDAVSSRFGTGSLDSCCQAPTDHGASVIEPTDEVDWPRLMAGCSFEQHV